jgi:hypothetical protein
MLYILWAILYLGLLIYFLYLLYRAIVVVKREMGIFPAIFLILIIGGQCSHSRKGDNTTSMSKNGKSMVIYSHKIKLSPIHSLIIDCDMDSAGTVINKHTSLTGVMAGVEWKPTTEYFNQRHYTIYGIMSWNLLGINIWRQSKTFEGEFTREDLVWKK